MSHVGPQMGRLHPTLLPRLTLGIKVNDSPLDANGHPLGQTSCHGLPGTRQNAAESLARDSHEPGGLKLGKPFNVGQAQGLEFIEREDAFLQVAQRNACRLEKDDTRERGDAAGATGTGHAVTIGSQQGRWQAACNQPPHRRCRELEPPAPSSRAWSLALRAFTPSEIFCMKSVCAWCIYAGPLEYTHDEQ